MKINDNEFYSLLMVQKQTGIKSRQYLAQYIKDGILNAIVVGDDEGKRYAIKGEWVKSFIERRKKGLIKGQKYTIPELKLVLQGTLDYCKANNLKTLSELVESIKKLNGKK